MAFFVKKKTILRGIILMQKKIIALLVLALLANVALFAGTTGKIAGRVKDQNGDPVPFANVLIEGLQQGAQTKENGTYIIINVQPGTYNLICSQMGYQPSKTTGVRVNLDETTIINITLNKTTIEVEGFVVREHQDFYSHRGAVKSISSFLKEYDN